MIVLFYVSHQVSKAIFLNWHKNKTFQKLLWNTTVKKAAFSDRKCQVFVSGISASLSLIRKNQQDQHLKTLFVEHLITNDGCSCLDFKKISFLENQ